MADSSIASPVGSVYLRWISFSKEPALTPMRIGILWCLAQATTSRTLASLPILPGLIRKQSAPASATASAILWSKCTSAISGTLTCLRISLKALTVSIVGVDTRIISAPASTQRWICATVAATSQVSVLVILCTLIGASPPIATLPTCIFLVGRRWIGVDVDIQNPLLKVYRIFLNIKSYTLMVQAQI